MSRRKGNLIEPPIEWVRLLSDASPDIHRVQLLWRRGAVPYRPLDPDELDEADASELPPTDLKCTPDGNNPLRDQQSIEQTVASFWEAAACWTRSRWSWCDFQLTAYDADGAVLFEDGRRCKLDGDDDIVPPDREHESESDRARERSREVHHWREVHQEHAKNLDRIIGYTRVDRDDAFRRSKQTLDDTSRLWSQANEAVREAIDYQREQIQRAKDLNSGRIELKARALTEMEKSQRFKSGLEFAKYGLDVMVTHAIPLANRLFDILGDRNMAVFPEFKRAQQAMAYLAITLTPNQLDTLMDKNREAAASFVAVLDLASEMEVEPEALEYMAALVRIFRSERFRDIALPEQLLAARFIIGRLALYRMMEYGEAQTTPAE